MNHESEIVEVPHELKVQKDALGNVQ